MKVKKINRVYVYTAFALIMLIMSWESNLASAALMNSTIPDQSIRIRILAHSDRVEDQWVKREIRDAITASVNTWSLNSKSIEEARSEVNDHLPELNALVERLLVQYGYAYGGQVELSRVHFPAKIFGRTTYPAGEYEALRVTLGAGQGQNWWCVLFPPLCFGSAIKANAAKADEIEMETMAKLVDNSSTTRMYQAPVQDGDDVEIKFFLWEKLKKFSGLFK